MPRSVNLATWNIPNPPEISSCPAPPVGYLHRRHIRVIELSGLRGLTLLFSASSNLLCHVYPRYSAQSSAVPSYKLLHNRYRRNILWVYLPLSKGDQILRVGQEKKHVKPPYLLETKLLGQIVAGARELGEQVYGCVHDSNPIALLCDEPAEINCIPSFLYTLHSLDSYTTTSIRVGEQEYNEYALGCISYFSSASLIGVLAAVTFEDAKGMCKGILF